MGREPKERYTSGKEIVLEKSNRGLSCGNNLNGPYIKSTSNIYTYMRKKPEKSIVIEHNALESFTCSYFFL